MAWDGHARHQIDLANLRDPGAVRSFVHIMHACVTGGWAAMQMCAVKLLGNTAKEGNQPFQ